MSGAAVPQRVGRARRSLPVGMWGMALFLCAETMLFGGLISSYFYLRLRASHWPPAGVADPPVLQPAILTAVLVASTVPVALASRRAREGELRGTIAMIALATVLQCGYLGYQLHQLVAELHILHPQASAYASAYVALVGFHHAHVLVGILLGLGLLVWLAVSGLSEYRVTGVRAFALYWYVVNLIALAVLFTEISPSI